MKQYLLSTSLIFNIVGTLHAGVVAHFPFDSNFSDTSGNGNHGVLVDQATLGDSGIISTASDYKFGGGAMDFSGADHLAIPSHTFSSGDPYTIAFWARLTAGDTGNSAVWDMVLGDISNNNHFVALGDSNNSNGLRWRGANSTTERQADFSFSTSYDWHHFALVASGTDLHLYRDGQLLRTYAGKLTGFILNAIGNAYTGTSYGFHGQIDELWILDEALAAPYILGLFQANDPGTAIAPPYKGFHFHFDEDYADSSPAQNGGTAMGNAERTDSSTWIARGSGALMLDGADSSYVALQSGVEFAASDPWTASWWARQNDVGNNKGMVMGKIENTYDFIWQNLANRGIRFRSSNGTTLDFTSPVDTVMRHYALVADGTGQLSLYVNGELVQTRSGDTSFVVNAIGKAYPTTSSHYNFSGSLDEVRLMPEALTLAQVAQIYEDEKPSAAGENPVTLLRVFLIGGQSNADGRAVVADLPVNLRLTQEDVDLYYKVEGSAPALTLLTPGLSESGQFGPEIGLGRRLADIYKEEEGTRIALIKYANGGTNLHTQWKAGGDATLTGDGVEYQVFQQTVTNGLAALATAHPDAEIRLQGMVWMQGESDAGSTATAEAYATNLTAFVADVRLTLGPVLPFIIGRLSDGQTNLNATRLAIVRTGQATVADADMRTGMISTDGFGVKSDNLHFNADGQLAMGAAFAEQLAYYVWMSEIFTPEDIDAGLAEPDADPDDDDQPNSQEFRSGANPLSAFSQFRADLMATGPQTAEISFPTAPLRCYWVERLNETTNTWEQEISPLPGDGTRKAYPLGIEMPRVLFRIAADLP